MKKIILTNFKVTGLAAFLIIFSAIIAYAYNDGITGRTLKTTTTGCVCHGPTNTTSVTVVFSGPDTIYTGQTVQYTLTVTKTGQAGTGTDIAVRTGILEPITTAIRLQDGELTHNHVLPMTNGTTTISFNYTASNTPNTDTIWANGNAVNGDSTNGGDFWNWANSKRIIVRYPIGIRNISREAPSVFSLKQNYPNPFNPSTKIRFEVPKNSEVKLSVFDLSGKEVEVILNAELSAGVYEADWAPHNLASGVYFCVLRASGFTGTKRLVLTK